MSFLLQALGLEEPEQKPSSSSWWAPDPKKGDYRDIKPAGTQVSAYGKSFVDDAAARDYARKSGKTKICPHCYNNPANRCYCSTCNGTGEVDISYGVF